MSPLVYYQHPWRVPDEADNCQRRPKRHHMHCRWYPCLCRRKRLWTSSKRPQQKNAVTKRTSSSMQFKFKELIFMDTVILDQEMGPDPHKVAAVIQMPPPQNKAALLHFNGMVIWHPSVQTWAWWYTLWILTQEAGSKIQDSAFNKAKKVVSSTVPLFIVQLWTFFKNLWIQWRISEPKLKASRRLKRKFHSTLSKAFFKNQ